jgi:hypothetical protein
MSPKDSVLEGLISKILVMCIQDYLGYCVTPSNNELLPQDARPQINVKYCLATTQPIGAIIYSHILNRQRWAVATWHISNLASKNNRLS